MLQVKVCISNRRVDGVCKFFPIFSSQEIYKITGDLSPKLEQLSFLLCPCSISVLFFVLMCFYEIRYLERNPQYWHPNHGLVVKELEDVNKIKMGLNVTHTMNFQEFGEKTKRRTELVMELKKIFEELNIRYNLLPQGIHLRHIESNSSLLNI